MARLPAVLGDRGAWGNVLVEFLHVAHNDDGTLKAIGLGAPANTNQALTIRQTGPDFAVKITSDGNAMLLEHTADLAGAVSDLVDMTLRSTGDAIYVLHSGGAPVGYGGPQGADAAFNVLIPGNLDGTTGGQGWDGVTANTRTGMTGLVVYAGAQGSYPVNVSSWSDNPAIMVTNQQAGHPQGDGPALYLDHAGVGAVMQVLHRGTSFTNATMGFTSFDSPAQDRQLWAARANGDANSRFTVDYKGMFTFGPGNVAQDIFLQRFAPGMLVLDKAIMYRAAAGDDPNGTTAIQTIHSGDNQTRFQIRHDGTMWWGNGTAGNDTNLYRTANDTLRTDDALQIGGALVHQGASLGVLNTAPVTKRTVTGSRATDAWRTSLMAALVAYGLVTDTSTA